MYFSLWFETINLGWPIVYINKGVTCYNFQRKLYFFLCRSIRLRKSFLRYALLLNAYLGVFIQWYLEYALLLFSLFETSRQFIHAFCLSKINFHKIGLINLINPCLNLSAVCKVYLQYGSVNRSVATQKGLAKWPRIQMYD